MALTPQQYLFLDALEQGKKITAAGSFAGVSESTARRWWKDTDVRREFDRRRRIARDLATARLQNVALEAVETLYTLMASADGHISRAAADAILKHKFKATEQDDVIRRVVKALKKHGIGSSPPEAAGGPPPQGGTPDPNAGPGDPEP